MHNEHGLICEANRFGEIQIGLWSMLETEQSLETHIQNLVQLLGGN